MLIAAEILIQYPAKSSQVPNQEWLSMSHSKLQCCAIYFKEIFNKLILDRLLGLTEKCFYF